MANANPFTVLGNLDPGHDTSMGDVMAWLHDNAAAAATAEQPSAAAGTSRSDAAAAAAAADANKKRQRGSGSEPDRAGLSGATSDNSSPLAPHYSFGNSVFKDLHDSATAQVQPAVSEAVKAIIAHHRAANRLQNLQRHQEAGSVPVFINKMLVIPELEDYIDEAAQQQFNTARAEFLSKVLSAAVSAAERAAAAAKTAADTAEAMGHPILDEAFSDMPPRWVHLPEVQQIKRMQLLKYEWEFSAAVKNISSSHKEVALKRQKKQAAADAKKAEAAPVSLQQQVEELATASTADQVKGLTSLVLKHAERVEKLEEQVKQQCSNSSGSAAATAAAAAAAAGKKKQQRKPKRKQGDAAADQEPPSATPYLDAAKAAPAGTSNGNQQQQQQQRNNNQPPAAPPKQPPQQQRKGHSNGRPKQPRGGAAANGRTAADQPAA